ncbi:hypothetical protein GCM10010211_81930 [Streptomyces albospinus]|uniref:Uncharacterized protein n=1 Tax=Streptomyces albospinus TaxID=285515 RepID=A0ABQ2VQA7_9ACTN|nr:hypothetical protein [Streptomyces albospinus]GGV02208.1 hypothetical protein GCM10010211_81930 [Streptomyces albospinus]
MATIQTPPQTLPESGPDQAALLFDTVTTDRLEPDHLLRLGAGVLGAIRIRGFFDADQCAQIMAGLENCTMGSYDESLMKKRIPKLGPAVFDYYQHEDFPAVYWADVERSTAVRAGLLDGADPLDLAKAKLADSWPGGVRDLTLGGRAMFSGMIREVNGGGGVHFDELVREFPGVVDETPVCQLAFNCHISVPSSGGELNVFRRRWEPRDEIRRGGDYFYPDDMVAGEPYASVCASLGDAVLFDPRNYHRILPAGPGRRVALAFFIGISGSGELVLWS